MGTKFKKSIASWNSVAEFILVRSFPATGFGDSCQQSVSVPTNIGTLFKYSSMIEWLKVSHCINNRKEEEINSPFSG